MGDASYVAQRSIERLHVLIAQNNQRQRRTERLHSMQLEKYIKWGEKDSDKESDKLHMMLSYI